MKNKGVDLEVWDLVHFQEYAHLSTTLLVSPLPLGRRWPVLSHTGVLPPGGRQTAGSSADRHMVSAVMNLTDFIIRSAHFCFSHSRYGEKKTVLTFFINTFISCEHYLLLLLHVFGSDHDRRVRKGRVVTSQPTSNRNTATLKEAMAKVTRGKACVRRDSLKDLCQLSLALNA